MQGTCQGWNSAESDRRDPIQADWTGTMGGSGPAASEIGPPGRAVDQLNEGDPEKIPVSVSFRLFF